MFVVRVAAAAALAASAEAFLAQVYAYIGDSFYAPRPEPTSLCLLAPVCSDPVGSPPLHFCIACPGHHPPGGQGGSGSWRGYRIANGGSHAMRTRIARTDPCRWGVAGWGCAVVPPRLISHACARDGWHKYRGLARACAAPVSETPSPAHSDTRACLGPAAQRSSRRPQPCGPHLAARPPHAPRG